MSVSAPRKRRPDPAEDIPGQRASETELSWAKSREKAFRPQVSSPIPQRGIQKPLKWVTSGLPVPPNWANVRQCFPFLWGQAKPSPLPKYLSPFPHLSSLGFPSPTELAQPWFSPLSLLPPLASPSPWGREREKFICTELSTDWPRPCGSWG